MVAAQVEGDGREQENGMRRRDGGAAAAGRRARWSDPPPPPPCEPSGVRECGCGACERVRLGRE
jgi:hypothetical protein